MRRRSQESRRGSSGRGAGPATPGYGTSHDTMQRGSMRSNVVVVLADSNGSSADDDGGDGLVHAPRAMLEDAAPMPAAPEPPAANDEPKFIQWTAGTVFWTLGVFVLAGLAGGRRCMRTPEQLLLKCCAESLALA